MMTRIAYFLPILDAERRFRASFFFAALVYVSGMLGMVSPFAEWFVALTPLSLLLSYVLLWWNQPQWGAGTFAFAAAAFCLGFFSEVLGVNTGFPFGDYAYGGVLGPKLWHTPLLIGVNWTVVGFGANAVVERWLPGPAWRQVLLGAMLPTVLDFLIEPVAIRLGYWHWAGNGVPPWQNYAGWFAVSLLVALAYRRWVHGSPPNRMAKALFGLQVLFFAGMMLLLGLVVRLP
jgi:putative membrane protein